MPRSRKWLITINNPIVHNFDHARIKASVLDLPSVVYWCMCDEQGDDSPVWSGCGYVQASAVCPRLIPRPSKFLLKGVK